MLSIASVEVAAHIDLDHYLGSGHIDECLSLHGIGLDSASILLSSNLVKCYEASPLRLALLDGIAISYRYQPLSRAPPFPS